MSFTLSVNSLSALRPIELSYSYNTDERLKSSSVLYSNGIAYNSYAAFDNIQDVALSKKTALFLTSAKSLSSILETTLSESKIGNIAGTLYLTTLSGAALQNDGETLSVQTNPVNRAKITVVPVGSDMVELYTNEGTSLVVDATYPYTVRNSALVLPPDQQYRKLFKIQYVNNLMTIQTITKEGPRFLSYGVDKILRAVGLTLNNAVINPYLFVPLLITKPSLMLGYNPATSEVKYYNDIESFKNRTNLDIKDKNVSDTNLLISCATSQFTKNEKANVNIALLRTNYTSTGTYSPIYVEKTASEQPISNENYLSDVDEITPILVEDLTNVPSNNKDGFLIYV